MQNKIASNIDREKLMDPKLLVQLQDISLHFGEKKIFNQASLSIHSQEKLCVLGRNGAGKSSLFKLITGKLEPDTGEVHLRNNILISQLDQDLPQNLDFSVFDYVQTGLEHFRSLQKEYQQLQSLPNPTHQQKKQLLDLQQLLDANQAWDIGALTYEACNSLELQGNAKLKELSGGWLKRCSLAKALVAKPDVLLLDEPTNHLDLNTINWLEKKIQSYQGSVMFISHDRAFMQKIATKILEIDRGQILTYACDYATYLKRREIALATEDTSNKLFDKKLAQEEVWIRQGIKARGTRNMGRVRELEAMRELSQNRIKRPKDIQIEIAESEPSGKKVISLKNLSYSLPGQAHKKLLESINLDILRGQKIGIIGNNGVGKSSLLKLFAQGVLEEHSIVPDSGRIECGAGVEALYFDQVLRGLDPEKSIAYNVAEGRSHVKINGKQPHIFGYLKDFLFTHDRAQELVKNLSGGEKNRLALAKLFATPSNLLLLDEPTNDLDLQSIEALEQALLNYKGTLILISHDRVFLDKLVSSCIVFEEAGVVVGYNGGFTNWSRQQKQLQVAETGVQKQGAQESGKTSSAKKSKEPSLGKKKSYKLVHELQQLTKKLPILEKQIDSLTQAISEESFYAKNFQEQQGLLESLSRLQHEYDKSLERWIELEEA